MRHDLILPTEKPGGIRIAWRSSEPEVLDEDGTILVGWESDSGTQVTLQAEITDGFYRDEMEVAAIFYPPERREAERNVMWLEKEVANYLGIEPIYTGGDLRKITSVLNRQRISGTVSSLPTTGTEN